MYPVHCEDHAFMRITIGVVVILSISYGIWSFNDQLETCHKSIFSLLRTEILQKSSFLQCRILYYECRCSHTLDRFNNSIHCITDIHVVIGHHLSLHSYAP